MVETTFRHLLLRGDFRRLLATRLLSQFGDGVFQAALAGTVLFNPQRAADAFAVAGGFATLLLPYSLVGPFAGVLLDRWSRQRVLLVSNALRGGLLVVLAVTLAHTGPAWVATTAAAVYLCTSWLASRLARRVLGPDTPARPLREALATVARGLLEGARHVHRRRP